MPTRKQPARKGTPRPTCLGNKFAVRNKGGRPRKWDEKAIAEETAALHKWMDNPNNYFFTSFLTARKLHPQQVERFAELSEEFCEAYARAKLVQEARIVEGALTRKFDGTFAKFILQNKAGWKEKSEVSGNAENPLAVIMERIALGERDLLDYDDR
jgi:hypothetical protein